MSDENTASGIMIQGSRPRKLKLREATPLDSLELNRFFSSIPVQGFLEIKVRRQVDFFSFFHRLGQKFQTFLLENSKSEILGTASFLFQTRKLGEQLIFTGYGCDLRISPQRKAILSWSDYFLPLIEKIKGEHNLDYLLTSLNLTESQVINAFIRPKVKRSNRPLYELVQKYNLVTIHGFYPFRFSLNDNILVSRFEQKDKEALIVYIQEKLKNYDLIPEELLLDVDRYIQKSLLYSWHQFFIAKDLSGKIVGCVHPLSSSLLQNYFPMSYNQQAHNFRQFLKFVSFFRIGRRLTRPYSRTQKEEALHFKMLHFLFFDHPDIFNSLVNDAYKHTQQNEFLIYAYQPENFQLRPPPGTIHTEIPYALYEMRSPYADRTLERQKSLKSKIKKWIYFDNMWF